MIPACVSPLVLDFFRTNSTAVSITPKLPPRAPNKNHTIIRGGVLGPRCYGCGRCIAVCPPGIIRAEKYKRSPSVVRELLEKVDGVEIHTKVGDTQNTLETLDFEGGWTVLRPSSSGTPFAQPPQGSPGETVFGHIRSSGVNEKNKNSGPHTEGINK